MSEGIDFDHNYGRAVIMFGWVLKLQASQRRVPRGGDGTDLVHQRSISVHGEQNSQGTTRIPARRTSHSRIGVPELRRHPQRCAVRWARTERENGLGLNGLCGQGVLT